MLEEAERTEPFRKNPDEETFLAGLNDFLLPVEKTFYADANPAECRPVFIVGAPRSGTTLLGQVLMSAGFGYISNFVARFWLAPSVGIRLQRAILGTGREAPAEFASRYGVTTDALDAHEFGYFWDQWFDLGQETHTLSQDERASIDIDGLTKSVAALCSQFDHPLVFKNTTWCSAQADFLAMCFPRAVFVFIERHPLFAAQSILVARRERYGSDQVWWSNRPSTFRDLKQMSPWEQVVGQVIDCVADTEASLAEVPGGRIVRLDYASLCDDPRAVARRVAAMTSCSISDGLVPARFDRSDRQRVSDEDWLELNRALDRRLSTDQLADGGDGLP